MDLNLEWPLFAIRVAMALLLLTGLAGLAVMAARAIGRRRMHTGAPALTLRVTATGRSYTVTAEAWLGRDPNCLIQLTDSFASGRHARLYLTGYTWWIEDGGSRNGTRVNGDAVRQQPLRADDLITIGSTEIRVVAGDPGYPARQTYG
jgi:pSer/pThr/pTyr-binding forkhead associated (FHA) protein